LSTVLLSCRQSDTWICLLMNRVVDSSHSKLSTVFYMELEFVRVRVCYRQAPWAVDNMRFQGKSEQVYEFVSDPNLELLVFFS